MPNRNRRWCMVPDCRHNQGYSSFDGFYDCYFVPYPADIERCRLWLKLTGNDHLVYLPPKTLHTNRFICTCHFADDQFVNSKRKRLKPTAVPTIFEAHIVPLSDSFVQPFPYDKEGARKAQSVELDRMARGIHNEDDKYDYKGVRERGYEELEDSDHSWPSSMKRHAEKRRQEIVEKFFTSEKRQKLEAVRLEHHRSWEEQHKHDKKPSENTKTSESTGMQLRSLAGNML